MQKSKEKGFIANILNNRYHNQVINSKLLCKLDPLNKTNIHKYIDNVPYLMILIKLKNGRILGGFSLSPFVKNSKGVDSIIFSVSQE